MSNAVFLRPDENGNWGQITVGTAPNPTVLNHEAYEGTVGTVAVAFTTSSVISKFSYIINDGTTDLYITFGTTAVTTTAGTQGSSTDGVIRLLGGESLNDFYRECSQVNFIRSTGSGTVRLLAEV
jgi:hypothetical protein